MARAHQFENEPVSHLFWIAQLWLRVLRLLHFLRSNSDIQMQEIHTDHVTGCVFGGCGLFTILLDGQE